MSRRLALMLFLFLFAGIMGSAVSFKRVGAVSKIYINADGSIYPSAVPIQRSGGIYTLAGDITSDNGGIEIDRNNMTLDGAGHTIQGSGSYFGVYLQSVSNITIKNTVIKSFSSGIYLSGSPNISILNDTVTAAQEEGVELYSSSNVSIASNHITSSVGGVFLSSSPNDGIRANIIVGASYGLNIQNSPCNISRNVIASCTQYGMWISNSAGCSIFQNNVTDNAIGIELNYSPLCTVYENQIANNQYGISFVYSLQNKIFHNNFVQNAMPPEGLQGTNTWDDGYPSGGNYWSGYNGLDVHSGLGQNLTGSDGIGDGAVVLDPQIANPQNIDHYPLMTLHAIPEFQPVSALLLLALATLLIVVAYGKKRFWPI